MWSGKIILLLFWLLLQQGSSSITPTEQGHVCPPSSCGKISIISYPFRLKHDPSHCGDSRYQLSCENNVTTLHLYSAKYHVESINYNNLTIRLVDPGLQQSNLSSLSRYSLSRSNFCDTYDYNNEQCNDPYHAVSDKERYFSEGAGYNELLFQHVVYLNCSHQVTNNSKYVNISSRFLKSETGYYIYVIAGDLIAEDFQVGCEVKLVSPTSWKWNLKGNSLTYDVIHKALVYGFEVSWLHLSCINLCGDSTLCYFNASNTPILQCFQQTMCLTFMGYWTTGSCGISSQMTSYAKDTITAIWIGLVEIIKGPNSNYEGQINYKVGLTVGHYVLPSLFAARLLFGVTFFISLLIYKWRKRHLSMYECIELYLQQENNLIPIRYSYKEIKKMAGGFKDKLGKGGFGSVFKGHLRSGPCVAIKMLDNSKGSGQDFINEVTTIGRIHHLNVVQLLGFCIEGSKRALVYEFMPNRSLDQFIFSKEGSVNLSYNQIHDISIGVARGIAYLHHGCEMKILHFDIKPHNILLDGNFVPKISDFGLAKLYPVQNNTITMTAAKGTIGYMAPELFYKNIGGVSYKADVYSFGMLLMEMASKRKNLNTNAAHSSQHYFPSWIYDQLEKEEEIEVENVTEEDMKIVKKMIIIALWCIQINPNNRPSMSKVVEMLQGEIKSLEMPPEPSIYPDEVISLDESTNSSQTISLDLISSKDSEENLTRPLVEKNY
ncbi:LEAF RUST 10 DISEASE-RESISTANCE LOCUS RECEPTOR-LIKE PROTEIN KINASE-like 2.1 isoform X2 [Vicia villosa]|uniref:LEAF RUST 10 DISEASE-RESISTANCE LOCUS RECEPTOR-LIKE PROTEIN KINASE-like 2.1 isoform X2 n=1 Tax=Vicia villosa TaxID=3911 RepID=UPI00273ABC96|nr:LEAF RUST 10 DISEASE-RESISTANCE LOCUS RECEPTOR-LIKE PROTEIN KINASE-like 2.1 isoform X2 [Vicia villosa]